MRLNTTESTRRANRMNSENENNLMKVVKDSNSLPGTTAVGREAKSVTVARDKKSTVSPGLRKAMGVGYNQEAIKDFLQKPIRLTDFTWSTQSKGSILYSDFLYRQIFMKDVYRQKVVGFRGFRATCVIRVQVNSNKFQAGRLLLCYVPQAEDQMYAEMRTRSLTAATQLPHVELDLSTQTEVVFEMPYVSPYPYYDLTTAEGDLGKLSLLVYSPLATGTGSTVATVTVWINFKDVELIAPIYCPVFIAEMGGVEEVWQGPNATTSFEVQNEVANATEAEAIASGNRPISTGLGFMGSVCEVFSLVPVLAPVATPAAWVCNVLSRIAYAFGYSKPSSESVTSKVTSTVNHFMQNSDGVDMFPSMGVSATNKLTVLDGLAGTSTDEMALDHLLRIPAFYTSFTWTTATTPDTILFKKALIPTAFCNTSTDGAYALYDATPLAFFASQFKFWRGGFKITLKIVKTTFHSGRLLISYNPAGSYGTAMTTDQTSYVLREIVDVRENVEYTYSFPYVSNYQYMLTGALADENPAHSIGYFQIQVLNQLTAPDTVSSSVEINLEVSAEPHFELAFPTSNDKIVYIKEEFSAEMGEVDNPIGASALENSITMDPAQYCIGERVLSILQLLKRYTFAATGALVEPVSGELSVRPFIFGAKQFSEPIHGKPTALYADYYSIFAPCFAYSRGGMRIMIAPDVNDEIVPQSGRYSAIRYYDGDDDQGVWLDGSHTTFNAPTRSVNYYSGGTNYAVGVNIPPYQQLHARINRIQLQDNTVGTPVSMSNVTAVFDCTTVEPQRYNVYRAASDDLQLGFFIGVPLLTLLP